MRIKPNPSPPPSIDTRGIIKKHRLTEEAGQFVKKFTSEFYSKFGVYPTINYSFDDIPYLITLNQLIDVLNDLILEDVQITHKTSVKDKTRKRTIVIYRQCGFKIASKMNYGCSRIAEAFGFDHATVLHANRVIQELIDTRDKQTLITLTNIENELKKRFGTIGDVQSDNSTGSDTKSVLSDI